MRVPGIAGALCLAGTLVAAPAAFADVTTQAKMTMSLGGSFDIGVDMTDYTTADKQRKDSEVHCSGFLSMLCGRGNAAEITRLDRGVTWRLSPEKKSYLETLLPTAEERAAARQRAQEMMARLQQCQANQPHAQQSVDRSKCDMSPPTVNVQDDGAHATFLGHDAQEHTITIGQTCTNRDTGDVCEFRYAFELWITPDAISGFAEQREFQQAYMKRLGLDPSEEMMQGMVRRFMAQYADQLKELSSKALSLKGTPLKTAFRFSIGGEHCGQAQKAQAAQSSGSSSSSSSSASSSPPPTSVGGAAAAMGAKLLGGMFKKNSSGTSDTSASAASSSSTSAAASEGGPSAGGAVPGGAPLMTVAAFTVETVSIQAGSIPADRFEVPAGWTKQVPPPPKTGEKMPSCADTQSE